MACVQGKIDAQSDASGVTVLIGILALLGSAFVGLFGLFFLARNLHGSQHPEWYLLAAAAWGVATAIGLFRLRRWARWSMVAFSALMLVREARDLTAKPQVAPPTVSAAIRARFVAVAHFNQALTGFLLALAIWWLVYFLLPGVKAQFEGAVGRPPIAKV